MKQNPFSFQLKLNPDDFLPASEEEKQSQVIMRESVSFWKDGMRRLVKNKVAMVSLVVIILVMISGAAGGKAGLALGVAVVL